MNHVSVIVPIYNAEKFLISCLDSILQQSHPAAEIILINDGSTDGSSEIATSYAKKHPQISLFHQENLGPSTARNRGLQEATNPYIQFVDADDTLQPHAIAQLTAQMKTGVDLVIYSYEREGTIWPIPIDEGLYTKRQLLPLFGLLYEATILPSPCNKLYRLENIRRKQLHFRPDLSYGEDLLFNLDYLATCQSIHLLDEPLYVYRKHPESLTNAYIPKLFQKQQALHQTVHDFIIQQQCDTATNLQSLDTIYLNQTLYAITNLFAQKNKALQKRSIRYILKSYQFQQLNTEKQTGIQARIFRYFVQQQAYRQAFLFFRFKAFLKAVIQ